ncbi:hypothetical protein DY000_02036573 [Brassica cretica]|uniref:Ribosomal protein S16 n=1 Tax=Brassica cretica TaxID=69181 RepID=A0ABQ7B562_BRACR|nr:hypothetical protein DY000_02036573 [Brassica cretica]
MTVKIRLARFGCKHRPFYRVVAADDKSRRDGKQIEVLGFYDPLQGKEDANRVSLKFDRIKYDSTFFIFPVRLYWLSVGAQPTDSVENMLFRAGLIPPKSMVVRGSKNGQQSTNQHVSPITGVRCYVWSFVVFWTKKFVEFSLWGFKFRNVWSTSEAYKLQTAFPGVDIYEHAIPGAELEYVNPGSHQNRIGSSQLVCMILYLE